MTTVFGNRCSRPSNFSRGRECIVDPFQHPAMAFHDTRACTTCGVGGATRHTCPFCPCNFCKKPGHTAPNCTKLQERNQQVGSSANRNLVASGPFSSPFSTRRTQPRLTRAQIRGLVEASSVAAATSDDEGRSSDASSDPQHPYAHDTGLLAKGKRELESENARKKGATSPTGDRESNSDNVSPLLGDEVNHPGLMAGSSVAAATSAGEGRSSGASSDSQHPYAHDTSLLAKRKREPEPENARKKGATSSTGNREPNSDNVSPLLDDEVNYPNVKNLHAGLTIEYRLLNLDASQQSFRSWSLLPLTFCGNCLLKNARSTSSIIRT